MKLRLKRVASSTGVILPKELLARLGLAQGDELTLSETPEGIDVSRSNEEFGRGMVIVREALKSSADVLW